MCVSVVSQYGAVNDGWLRKISGGVAAGQFLGRGGERIKIICRLSGVRVISLYEKMSCPYFVTND